MESGNDYVIQVKGNARKLRAILLDKARAMDPADITFTKEINRGRTEMRECMVYSIEDSPLDYKSINTFIHVKNTGTRCGKRYEEDHYYASNKKLLDADYYLKGIRNHWSIENSCHWVKDAIMYEDNSRVKGMALSENLSIIRNIVINLFRLNGEKSIKKAIEKYCNRLNQSTRLINQLHIRKS